MNFIFLSNCSSSLSKKIVCRIILKQMLNLFLRGDFSCKILYISINLQKCKNRLRKIVFVRYENNEIVYYLFIFYLTSLFKLNYTHVI